MFQILKYCKTSKRQSRLLKRRPPNESVKEVPMQMKTILILFCFGLSQVGYAQSGTKDQSQNDLAALRTDVKALQVEQHQILSRLDELKQILQSYRQPPVSSVSVRGETFRGDAGARVAIIEYADFECPYCG